MKKIFILAMVGFGILSAQTYDVGDIVPDFSGPICANGTGDWVFYDYNGDLNGGSYHIVLINLFTSW